MISGETFDDLNKRLVPPQVEFKLSPKCDRLFDFIPNQIAPLQPFRS